DTVLTTRSNHCYLDATGAPQCTQLPRKTAADLSTALAALPDNATSLGTAWSSLCATTQYGLFCVSPSGDEPRQRSLSAPVFVGPELLRDGDGTYYRWSYRDGIAAMTALEPPVEPVDVHWE